ncbi:hypothetical protein N824_22885 [Pedobacter sp. V48]|nr:hypothetical protein N824_22885 [Pedobacter sp. V48]
MAGKCYLALTTIEQQTIILIVYLYNIDAKVLRFKLIQKRFEYKHRQDKRNYKWRYKQRG